MAQLGTVGALAAQQPALIPQQQLGGVGIQQQQPMQFGGMQQPFAQQQQQQQQPIQFGGFQQQPLNSLQFGGGQLPLGGAAVLPQNFQAPVAGQLNQPVLSPQQAAQLIPMDQMQAALNARVAASGQMGVMPPAQGLGGVGVQQQQPMAMQFGGIQQQQPMQFGGFQQQQPIAQNLMQQQPMQFGGVQMQQPLGVGMAQGQIPYPATAGLQQQQPFAMGIGAQQPIMQQPFGGVGAGAQQPFMGQPNIGQMPQMGF